MKKILSLVALMILVTPALSSAEENIEARGSYVKPFIRIDNQIERKEIKLEKIEDRLSSTTASTSDKRIEQLEKRSENIENQIERKKELVEDMRERLEAREFRIVVLLENISKRIGERITLLEEKGVVLSDAKTSLSAANDKIQAVKDEVEKIKTLIETEMSTSTNSEIRDDIKETKDRIKVLAKEAHSLLVETVKNIAGALPKKGQATSTNN